MRRKNPELQAKMYCLLLPLMETKKSVLPLQVIFILLLYISSEKNSLLLASRSHTVVTEREVCHPMNNK